MAMDGPETQTKRRLDKYVVDLSPEARWRLEDVARNGSAPAKKILHARVLLMSDSRHESGRYHDHEIAKALGVHENTVARVRKLFVLGGEAPALDRKPRAAPPTPPRLDGRAQATLVAICCSPPPAGRVRWTLSLLAGEMVGRKVVTAVCRETVRKALKKTPCGPGASSGSASPNVTRRGSSRRWKRC
jgi:Homeodomain-like domain